jgi:hypothetical protein
MPQVPPRVCELCVSMALLKQTSAYVSICQHTSAYVSIRLEYRAVLYTAFFFDKKTDLCGLGGAIDVREKVKHVSTSAVCKAVCKACFFLYKNKGESRVARWRYRVSAALGY